MQRRLWLRVDGGFDLGMGHVMRCIALAEIAAERDLDVRFVAGGGAAVVALRRRRLAVDEVSVGAPGLDAVGPGDIVVVDGYHFADPVFEVARARARIVVAVDDRDDPADAVNIVVSPDSTRATTMAEVPVLLTGPDHALVRREFRERRRLRRASPDGHLLVTMGGSDTASLGPACAAIARQKGWPNVEVLVGPAARTASDDADGLHWIIDPPDVGAVFDRAAAVVTAAGSSAWELLAMGQACALVEAAWDQHRMVETVGEARAAITNTNEDDRDAYIAWATERLGAPEVRTSLSERALDLVDGNGARRVIDAMLSL